RSKPCRFVASGLRKYKAPPATEAATVTFIPCAAILGRAARRDARPRQRRSAVMAVLADRSLKWLLMALGLAGALPARALDATPETARIVSDPLYLPLEGQIYGDTAYRWS